MILSKLYILFLGQSGMSFALSDVSEPLLDFPFSTR